MRQRRVVCAAVRYPCGTMLTGPRHFDGVMLSQYRKFFGDGHAGHAPGEEKSIQGFLDQRGVFMDRYEALGIATDAGQIIEKTNPADRLFSEDIY